MNMSEFYYACRNGDVVKVKKLLSSMSTTEIDHIEPNGSTALHAAAYFGHIDIVRLLLGKGASRSQKNKYDKTPEEEAKSPDIAQLFQNVTDKTDDDWIISNVFNATSQHRRFYSFNQGSPTLSYVVDKILHADELWNLKEDEDTSKAMDFIKKLCEEAIQNNDATRLINAYTAPSSFYLILNKTLANHNGLTNEERENPPWFCAYARFLASDDPTLRSYRWTGIAYYGSSISKHRIDQWQVGKMLMNKVFLAASKNINIGLDFARRSEKNNYKLPTIFKCIVNDDRTALDTISVSYFPMDEEVLILPYMDFEITEINYSDQLVEITLLLH